MHYNQIYVRRYIGDFDANGVANYYMTDYQGNVTEVVIASGAVVQSVRYYPDGEPWMEPTGTNRYTFGGKERVNLGGLNQYDFGPRLFNAAAGVWGAPDRKAEKFYSISPYSYCAGNPVMFTDPTGEIPSTYEAAMMAEIVYEIEESEKSERYEYNIEELNKTNWRISNFKTSIKMNHPAKTGIGLQSVLFEREVDGVKEYAYVYAGTNSWEDGVEDLVQLIGLSPQYAKAIGNAETLVSELGDSELTFVGHSLGAALAAASSMRTHKAAIGFNPAALSYVTKKRFNLEYSSNIINYVAVPGNSKPGGCVVYNVQNAVGMTLPGMTIGVPMIMNSFRAHRIENMVDFFRDPTNYEKLRLLK